MASSGDIGLSDEKLSKFIDVLRSYKERDQKDGKDVITGASLRKLGTDSNWDKQVLLYIDSGVFTNCADQKSKKWMVIDKATTKKFLGLLQTKMQADKKCKDTLDTLVDKAKPKTVVGTKTSKTGSVEHFSDASKYTGSHKGRFDAEGKGKGIAGREDRAANDGYVGAYKEKDTYDKKH